jgi:hypothetical protein
MSISKYLILIILLFVVCDVGCKSKVEHKQIRPPKISLIANELFKIDDQYDKNSIIGRIGYIKIDKNKKIYVSDNLSLHIKIFNSNGKFDKNIGGRGQDPGQFQEITTFEIIGDSLVVFDRMLSVVHILGLDGKFIDSKKVNSKSHTFPALVLYADGKLFALNRNDINDNLLTVSKTSGIGEDEKNESVINFTDVDLAGDNFFNGLMRFAPGHLTMGKNKIYYVPELYTDKIYVSENKNGKWNKKYINGFTEFEEPYTALDPKLNSKFLNSLSNYGDFGYKGKKYKATIHTISKGIYTFENENRLLNFLSVSKMSQKKADNFVEIFDTNTELSIGYGELKTLHKLDNILVNEPLLTPLAKDENDVFYMRDNSLLVPVIRAVKLKIE